MKTDTSVFLKDVSKCEKSRKRAMLRDYYFFYFKLCYVSRYQKENFSTKH